MNRPLLAQTGRNSYSTVCTERERVFSCGYCTSVPPEVWSRATPSQSMGKLQSLARGETMQMMGEKPRGEE